MSSIIRRLMLIVKVWLDALLAPAEDPRQVFKAAYQQQRELLDKVRLARGRVAGSRRKLEAKAGETRGKLPRLEDQARQALSGGREDLARFALQLRQVAVEDLEDLERQVAELDQEERALELVEQRLAAQIEAFFARQEVLEARYTTAEAQVRVGEVMGGVSEELADLTRALERAEQTSEDMQARVEAIEGLVETGILDGPAQRLAGGGAPALPGARDTMAVEAQLDALKSEVSGSNAETQRREG